MLNTSQRPGFVTVICPSIKPAAVKQNDNGIVHWRWDEGVSFRRSAWERNWICRGRWTLQPRCARGPGRCDELEGEFYQRIRWVQTMLGATLGRRIYTRQSPFFRQLAGACHGPAGARAELLHGHPHYHVGIGAHAISIISALFHHQWRAMCRARSSIGTLPMQSTLWALLEPAGMKVTLRRWLVQNARSGLFISTHRSQWF